MKNVLGKNLKDLRQEFGLSQSQLADKLVEASEGEFSLSYKAISKWEQGTGYPEIPTLVLLGRVFEVTIDYLLLGIKSSIVMSKDLESIIDKSTGKVKPREEGRRLTHTEIQKAIDALTEELKRPIHGEQPVVVFSKPRFPIEYKDDLIKCKIDINRMMHLHVIGFENYEKVDILFGYRSSKNIETAIVNPVLYNDYFIRIPDSTENFVIRCYNKDPLRKLKYKDKIISKRYFFDDNVVRRKE